MLGWMILLVAWFQVYLDAMTLGLWSLSKSVN